MSNKRFDRILWGFCQPLSAPPNPSYSLQLFMYEALGLCEEGQGGRLVDSGRWISNSKGGSHKEVVL